MAICLSDMPCKIRWLTSASRQVMSKYWTNQAADPTVSAKRCTVVQPWIGPAPSFQRSTQSTKPLHVISAGSPSPMRHSKPHRASRLSLPRLASSVRARRLGCGGCPGFSTKRRLLERLVARQYVTRSAGGDRHALSLKMFALAHRHPPVNRMVTQALPVMDAYARQAEQSCHLGMVDRGNVLVIAQVPGPGTWGLSIRLGARVSLLDTASGHVLLACQSNPWRAKSLFLPASWMKHCRAFVPWAISNARAANPSAWSIFRSQSWGRTGMPWRY